MLQLIVMSRLSAACGSTVFFNVYTFKEKRFLSNYIYSAGLNKILMITNDLQRIFKSGMKPIMNPKCFSVHKKKIKENKKWCIMSTHFSWFLPAS